MRTRGLLYPKSFVIIIIIIIIITEAETGFRKPLR